MPGGFGERGIEGKIKAIECARLNKILLGMSGNAVGVVEFARNVSKMAEANSTEFDADSLPVVALISEWTAIIAGLKKEFVFRERRHNAVR